MSDGSRSSLASPPIHPFLVSLGLFGLVLAEVVLLWPVAWLLGCFVLMCLRRHKAVAAAVFDHAPPHRPLRPLYLAALLPAAITLVGGAFVLVGGVRFVTALHNLVDTSLSTVQGELALLNTVQTAVQTFGEDLNPPVTSSVVSSISQQTNVWSSQLGTVHSLADGVYDGLLALVCVLGGTSILGVLFSTLYATLRWRALLTCSSFWRWLALFFNWLFAGLCYAMLVAAEDSAAQADWVLTDISGHLGKLACLQPGFLTSQRNVLYPSIYDNVNSVSADTQQYCGGVTLCNPIALAGGVNYTLATAPCPLGTTPLAKFNISACPSLSNNIKTELTAMQGLLGVAPAAEQLLSCTVIYSEINLVSTSVSSIVTNLRILSGGTIIQSAGNTALLFLTGRFVARLAGNAAAEHGATGEWDVARHMGGAWGTYSGSAAV